MIKIAIMGFGTIGSGVYEVLEENRQILSQKAGQDLEIKYILDLRDFPGTAIEQKVIHDFSVIERDPEIRIVVETMGGLNPAYPFVKACLEAGKHVVTSNKALVAAHGTELLKIARDKHVNFQFEASVGGGIPIIRTMYRSLAGEKILEITGILNGTTNFILTKMDREGASFEDALAEAQRLGYAERNPEADVEGHDTCRKIAILTAMATGKEVCWEDIHTEGITKITSVDFAYAEKLKASVKLFGSSRLQEDEVHAWVAPVMIGKDHPLYLVSDVYNGVLVKGNNLGTSMYYGSGAGKLPTASAVAADILEAAQNLEKNVPLGWSSERLSVAPFDTSCHRYFVRFAGKAENGEADVREAFGPCQVVSLDDRDEFAVVTDRMNETTFCKIREQFEKKYPAGAILQVIRAEF